MTITTAEEIARRKYLYLTPQAKSMHTKVNMITIAVPKSG